jgi:hypothetical protein
MKKTLLSFAALEPDHRMSKTLFAAADVSTAITVQRFHASTNASRRFRKAAVTLD